MLRKVSEVEDVYKRQRQYGDDDQQPQQVGHDVLRPQAHDEGVVSGEGQGVEDTQLPRRNGRAVARPPSLRHQRPEQPQPGQEQNGQGKLEPQ